MDKATTTKADRTNALRQYINLTKSLSCEELFEFLLSNHNGELRQCITTLRIFRRSGLCNTDNFFSSITVLISSKMLP